MFGGGSGSSKTDVSDQKDQNSPSPESGPAPAPIKTTEQAASGEKRSGNGSPPGRQNPDTGSSADKKRRSSGVGSKASSLINAAKNSLISANNRNNSDVPLEKLGKQDPALAVPQGSHNNSAGESVPGPRSTFRVGVWEDRNKKCRRTMEDTHAFLYNFLATPAPTSNSRVQKTATVSDESSGMIETDNGYFAIFDGHAGTFAADWCGKKLHIILEEIIRKNPNQTIPTLLDEAFTTADEQLAKLPVKNSGCTAAIALLRWEDRVPTSQSVTGSQGIASALAAELKSDDKASDGGAAADAASARLKAAAARQRVLYTANVGDARIILCRDGKALRLSYDHKGSDENEGKRIANAGGLILNNRVNGVLAVTRALGDSYMKELVTGHPYTTETVIKPDLDEFILIACDGLWDVCSDQEAVDLVRNIQDPVAGSKLLVDHALSRFSTDNLSCMIVRFDRDALREAHTTKNIGVEGDATGGQLSEAEKIVNHTKQQIAEGGLAIGGTNSGKAHESIGEQVFKPTIIEGAVQEEPVTMDTEGITSKHAPESKEDKKATGAKQDQRMPDLEEEPTPDAGDKDKASGLPS